MTIRSVIFAVLLGLVAVGAQADEKLALVMVNKDYQNFREAPVGQDPSALFKRLAALGFKVRIVRNFNSNAITRLMPGIRRDIAEADTVLVIMSGHVFTTGRESWLMATDARRDDGVMTGRYGLPINEFTDLLADKAGAAVLVVGDSLAPSQLADGLSYGYRARDIAQGVTVLAGRTGKLVGLLRNSLLVEGTTTASVARAVPAGVKAYGFLSRSVAFLPAPSEPEGGENAGQAGELEQLIWDNAVSAGSAYGFETYLDRFPGGFFASQAQELLTQLQRSPADIARDVEAALGLNRDQRREVQRHLSLLGFNPRGIDGVFGPGTRGAVRAWQDVNDFTASGFLTGNQITALEAGAAVRAAELEEEARKRRAEQDRQDAIFWRSTGRKGSENGLRVYLGKYPDGLYSEIALDRLAVFEDERRRSAELAEGSAWDVAAEGNTIAGYRKFLERYPNGTFSDIAKNRLTKLQAAKNNGAAAQQERKVMGNPITRLLVEQKLAALGFKPGRVDGTIDDKTRKAVRQFQRAAGLDVSGYVTQATIVRLLAAR